MQSTSSSQPASLSNSQRIVVLIVAFCGLVFDGFELGLMPVASLSVTKSLMGDSFSAEAGGKWFAWYTAALMLGAAVGGITLGNLGDRWGRRRAMSISILIYSLFAGLGAFVQSQEQMLILRFLVGLGTGGMLPNGVALAAECWPNASRALISGLMGAGINVGIMLLGRTAAIWHLSEDSWRWVFYVAAFPAVLAVLSWYIVPESPTWQATRNQSKKKSLALTEMFGPGLLRVTLIGVMLGAIPLLGAWAASKWMLPWADKVASATHPGYKGTVQFWWACGAILGSFMGAQIAKWLGRRVSYFFISLGSVTLTWIMFRYSAPLRPSFIPIVCVQGFVSTLFFGWLPLYLPELFPTRARASGMGLSYNVGRFATAFGVLFAGYLLTKFNNSMPMTGSILGLIYGLGMFVIWLAPSTDDADLSSS